MHKRRGLFFQSLFVTLLLILPMFGAVLFLAGQRAQQDALKQAAAGQSGVSVAKGAQKTLTVLAAIQSDDPAFLLLRFDGPAQQLLVCGLPGQTLTDAPAGQTTLAECYLAAGPARAAQLLSDTVGASPDGYLAATADCYADIWGGEYGVRFDTAGVLDAGDRTPLGYGQETVAALSAADTADFIARLQQNQTPPHAAEIRAAVWGAYFRQGRERLAGLTDALRSAGGRTLTDLRAQDLLDLEDILAYFSTASALTVEYTAPAMEQTAAGWALTADGAALLREILGAAATPESARGAGGRG